jgi:hypothetical protein
MTQDVWIQKIQHNFPLLIQTIKSQSIKLYFLIKKALNQFFLTNGMMKKVNGIVLFERKLEV